MLYMREYNYLYDLHYACMHKTCASQRRLLHNKRAFSFWGLKRNALKSMLNLACGSPGEIQFTACHFMDIV